MSSRSQSLERPTSGASQAPARRLRVGLIGCGAIARQYHLRILCSDPRVDLVAVADPSEQARAAAGESGAALYQQADELLARDDLDAVVVCASSAVHGPIASAVARSEHHLYLEKPVAIELKEARALQASLGSRGPVTAVGFNFRRSPALERLREQLGAGRIGTPRRLRGWHCEAADAASMPEWKRMRETGGGVPLDLISHQVDFARWLLDDEVAAVEAAQLSSIQSEGDDARVELRMERGVAVEFVASYVQGRKFRWEIEGEDGVLRAERWPARVSRRRRAAPGGPSGLATALLALPIPRREPSFERALGEFVGAALGEPHSLPTIDDGIRSLETVLEVERVAAEHVPSVERVPRVEHLAGVDRVAEPSS